MYLEKDCSQTTIEEWEELTKNAKPISYKWLIAKIKKRLPALYENLGLQFFNPWHESAAATKNHYILVASGTEYFIHK